MMRSAFTAFLGLLLLVAAGCGEASKSTLRATASPGASPMRAESKNPSPASPAPVEDVPSPMERDSEAFRSARMAMVRQHIAGLGIKDRRVLEAMRAVPRHQFVPKDLVDRAYENRPLPIGFGQTISQPYIVALMTELLDLAPGEKV